MERKKLYASFVLIAVASVCLFVLFKGQNSIQPETVGQKNALNTSSFQFEISDSPSEQERGLSGRTNIPSNYGMLFVFAKEDRYGFWMKGMLSPIDILWLSDNGTIIGIEHSVATSTYPRVFYPPQPVRYVLETRVGEAMLQGWNIGQALALPL